MKSVFYDILDITNKEERIKVSKKCGISVEDLEYYSNNSIIPIGENKEKIKKFLEINETEYKLLFGDVDAKLLEKIKMNAKKITEILGPDDSRSSIIEKSIPDFTTDFGKLYNSDCMKLLKETPNNSVDMFFADPPFNLGKKYNSSVNDNLEVDAYVNWCSEWIREGVRILKPGGSLFLWNIPKWNVRLSEILSRYLNFRNWIAVDMKYGMPIRGRLYPAHYSLLYYSKGKKVSSFTPERIPLDVCPVCGHEIKDYGGYKHRLNEHGMTLSDVWKDIYPVRHSKYKNRKSNELSIKLMDRIIGMSTKPGDTIFDPFGGSGTTYLVAELLKRRWIGSEIGSIKPIENRLVSKDKERDQLKSIHDAKNRLFLNKTIRQRKSNNYWLP
ncbi:hypothetical protein FC19_GL001062 [Liquorilactobacillus aquaticus DSM 21051]|uniref:DNA methylase N-4/N-6 domain-containing protein n=1 Tax=Liquorilactobacillus aquaticus DSM 21051 TaxID=1423725 RepID=A0A0R2CVZ2_9LACO|nr:site-specific DNA-methyltransferase [Liquorilactobacillus aquaticus]KRM95998.1 hypothetical protein FC19_GL001062 [Liquorilactobacillus aquaticus DSM 21051]